MNSMSSIICPLKPASSISITVNNANFTSPVVANGNQLGITSTTQVTNWTISDINTTNSSIRILNNLSITDNASPVAYDASANGTTGFIKTVFFVTQQVPASTASPKITTLSQSITIPSSGTYTISVCIAPRNSAYTQSPPLYYSTQYFGIKFGTGSVSSLSYLPLTGAASYKTGSSQTLANFTQGTTTQSFYSISGTWTGTAGSYTLFLCWQMEADSVDTTIMATGVTIIKQ